MLASQIISDARKELLETTQQYWSDTELIRYINRCELDYNNKTRILEDEAELSLVTGQIEYPLPSNFVSEKIILFKIVNQDGTYQWKRLYPLTLEKAVQQQSNFLNTTTDNQGRPTRFFIWNKRIILNKAPTDEFATSIHLYFKSKPIPLSVSTDVLNLDDDLYEAVLSFVLWKAWAKEQETELADDQKLTYDRYVAEGRKWIKKRSGDMRYRLDLDSPQSLDGNFFPFGPLTD